MSNKKEHFLEHLEWEIVETEQIITNLSFENRLYNLNKDCFIVFSRDNQYNLTATISGILNHHKEIKINSEEIQGSFVEQENIYGYSIDGFFKFKFSGAIIGKHTISQTSIHGNALKFNADLIFDKVEKIYNGDISNTVRVQEWYLSSNLNFHFPRATKRSVKKDYKRIRENIDPDTTTNLTNISGFSRDYLVIKTTDFSCIIAKVPDEYGPKWSSNLCIEYRESFGKIPDKEIREAISELVSFIFGSQLLNIGQTSYNKEHSMTLQEYSHPWGDNVVSKCQKIDLPPIDIRNNKDWWQLETLLNEMTSNYLQLRPVLRLNNALWKYWIARNSALGTNLPILSSAIETLAEQVLKSNPQKKHYYVEYDLFQEILKNELISIGEKLKGYPNYEKILNKIKSAAQRGSNEKIEMMFEILNLPVGKTERIAIRARNKMAHSSIGKISNEEIEHIIKLTRAYETLFHRILLKILGFKGQYIDYYTLGLPNRNIDEPIA